MRARVAAHLLDRLILAVGETVALDNHCRARRVGDLENGLAGLRHRVLGEPCSAARLLERRVLGELRAVPTRLPLLAADTEVEVQVLQ